MELTLSPIALGQHEGNGDDNVEGMNQGQVDRLYDEGKEMQ